MEPFKEGDWVRDTRAGMKRPIVQLQPNCIALTNYEKYGKHFIKWIPEPGVWCWFYDNETDVPTLAKLISINKLFDRKETYMVATPSCVSESSYNYSRTMTFKHCEPFIGELPSNIEDL